MELIPSEEGWYIQKLSCGHTSRIRIMEPIIEKKVKISDKVKAVPIDYTYGQVYTDKTTKDSRSILCKCGHRGNDHKFLSGYTGDHNCYKCNCSNYGPA